MNKAEYERLKKALLEEYEKSLAALETTWEVSRRLAPRNETVMPVVNENGGGSNEDREASITDAVHKMMKHIPPNKEFTVQEIADLLRKEMPSYAARVPNLNVAISGVLQRLKARERIKQVNQKSGSTPGVYVAA